MSGDLRAAIAEALVKHGARDNYDDEGEYIGYICACRAADSGPMDTAHAAHVAAVVSTVVEGAREPAACDASMLKQILEQQTMIRAAEAERDEARTALAAERKRQDALLKLSDGVMDAAVEADLRGYAALRDGVTALADEWELCIKDRKRRPAWNGGAILADLRALLTPEENTPPAQKPD